MPAKFLQGVSQPESSLQKFCRAFPGQNHLCKNFAEHFPARTIFAKILQDVSPPESSLQKFCKAFPRRIHLCKNFARHFPAGVIFAKILQGISRPDATNALKGQPAISPGQSEAAPWVISPTHKPSPYRGKSQTISKETECLSPMRSPAFAPLGCFSIYPFPIPRVPFRFAPFCPGLIAFAPPGRFISPLLPLNRGIEGVWLG